MKTTPRSCAHRLLVVVVLSVITIVNGRAIGATDAIELLEALETSIFDSSFDDIELREVLDIIERDLPAGITADWTALDAIFVDPDDRIELNMPRASAAAVIDGVIRQLGDEFDRPVLEVHAGQYMLTSRSGAARYATTLAYDVRDLLARDALDRLRDEMTVDEADGHAADAPTEDEAPKTIDDAVPTPTADESSTRTPGEELLERLAYHVDPDAWVEYGGSRAKITERDGVLLVTAAPSVHRRLRYAVEQLRSAYPTMVEMTIDVISAPAEVLESLAMRRARSPRDRRRVLLGSDQAHHVWHGAVLAPLDERATLETSDERRTVRCAVDWSPPGDDGLMRGRVALTIRDGGLNASVNTTIIAPTGSNIVSLRVDTPKTGAAPSIVFLDTQTR